MAIILKKAKRTRKKRKHPGGRGRLTLEQRRAVRERLEELCETKTPPLSHRDLAKSVEVTNRTTFQAWFQPDPVTPDLPVLVRLGEQFQVTLDWLVLGKGSRLQKGQPVPA